LVKKTFRVAKTCFFGQRKRDPQKVVSNPSCLAIKTGFGQTTFSEVLTSSVSHWMVSSFALIFQGYHKSIEKIEHLEGTFVVQFFFGI
jgi:hypothetical protein